MQPPVVNQKHVAAFGWSYSAALPASGSTAAMLCSRSAGRQGTERDRPTDSRFLNASKPCPTITTHCKIFFRYAFGHRALLFTARRCSTRSMSHYHATVPSQINDALTTPLSVTGTSEDSTPSCPRRSTLRRLPSARTKHVYKWDAVSGRVAPGDSGPGHMG